MIIVDTHVHVALHTYDPVEMLLTQMQYNNVEKTVLVQSSTTTDNSYVIECKRRFPSRLAVVCRVDVDSPSAASDLQHWHEEGAESIRLRHFHVRGHLFIGERGIAELPHSVHLDEGVGIAGQLKDLFVLRLAGLDILVVAHRVEAHAAQMLDDEPQIGKRLHQT